MNLIYKNMKLEKYDNWILENKIYNLILESKIIYSKKFIKFLSRMKSNKIAKDLLSLYTKDIEPLNQNYIEVSDNKDEVTFIQDRKAKEINKDKPETWIVKESGRYLTTSSSNDRIFQALGYDKEKYRCWDPERDTVGLIMSETVSRVSGKIYVMFQEYNVPEPRIGVLNKEAIQPSEAEDGRVWTSSRNPIRVGKLARAILNSAKITFTDKEIEDFTNQYKATFDLEQNALQQFDIVNGNKIAYWYDNNKYIRGGGTLNNSCMAEVDESYFRIYTENSNVSLVILYSDDGNLEGTKYTSDKIKGRAILWTALVDGQPAKFMDRIYTVQDSDVELFKQFAEKNGFWWKRNQNMDQDESLTDGKATKRCRIKVELDKSEFYEYPYLDTMSYLNENDGCLYNYPKGDGKELRDTGGGYDEYSD